MNYEASHALNNPKFKRRFGVQRATFKRMVKAVKTQIPALPGPGRPAKLSIIRCQLHWRLDDSYKIIRSPLGI